MKSDWQLCNLKISEAKNSPNDANIFKGHKWYEFNYNEGKKHEVDILYSSEDGQKVQETNYNGGKEICRKYF